MTARTAVTDFFYLIIFLLRQVFITVVWVLTRILYTFIIPHRCEVFECSGVARTELIKATTALETAVFVTMHWLASVKPSSGLLYTIAEELKSQVKKMGGFFQMLIQVNICRYIKLFSDEV